MSRPTVLRPALLRRWLLPRRAAAHKGDFGHALVLAGSRGMTGAAGLCAAAALRGGAGLVTLGVPAGQRPLAARRVPREIMTLALPESPRGTFSARALDGVRSFLSRRRPSAVAAGPGLGLDAGTVRFVKGLLVTVRVPLVLDADALNALAKISARPSGPLALTPHPGEAARLLGSSTRAVQADRPAAAAKLARKWNAVCVLKGRGTIVADGRRLFSNPTGNPGMATGGTGDVLCGLVAALAAQTGGGSDRERLFRAAAIGVYVHGLAGDLAARRRTRIAMTAGDLLESLPEAFRRTFGPRI